MVENLRNIAIIAHVDHGKTTLVDQLLQQSGTLDARGGDAERVMDSDDLERERGITILSKNTAIDWQGYRINIVDTPGHADFGGEVERVLSMADSVLLLVDAQDGPMPQTRFVTEKAFALGLQPIVVVNKIDRPGARPNWVIDQTFDLFADLGATEEQLDFPVIYASALGGYAGEEPSIDSGDMTPLFQTIVDQVRPPQVDSDGPFQMQITTLDYSKYLGQIGIGRIKRGHVTPGTTVTVVDREGNQRSGRIQTLLGFLGLERVEIESADAGNLVAITGIDPLDISDTLCDPQQVEALPALTVDEPTVSMGFEVNKSPFAGREGRYVTSRQIRERLDRELKSNVALRVEATDDPDRFHVSGRGLLHLSVVLENMRREGYEIAVSRPAVITRTGEDGRTEEPYEHLVADIESDHQGAVIDALNERGGRLQDMQVDSNGRVRLEYTIPARGLIGFQTDFMSLTSGTGILTHVFDHYGPRSDKEVGQRREGAMISGNDGKAVAYALFNLQERGRLMVSPNDPVYEGMLIGLNSRDADMTVNPLKAKELTNVRAAGSDENVILTPPMQLTLEYALELINDDELVEITPESIRMRKRLLTESERKRHKRAS
ncbi:MAG: translational GTPase TypA [Halorhodospira halophila]|uniref:translational GTPase TypA n=1 Tax=Halorhodospira TaxID=85108 RepID=UPI00191385B7|nr:MULTISPECIES: translational GTPase TypA [Halorhodospira]MBK5935503.1 translational GTPase TypA [Halorhodospira halophila]MBK5942483.1 translational GTPase TypA [Halorhodospira halophila]MCC3750615.1 translational GTPase TypA [Halorhodospira halophila]MCG5528264.1 translational GTPase TypA [Halorhodospira halophila]MCG5532033.1 translational GTPase TypA [Halorhodospira sp. 9621]